jgi:hypothetical protein
MNSNVPYFIQGFLMTIYSSRVETQTHWLALSSTEASGGVSFRLAATSKEVFCKAINMRKAQCLISLNL